MMTTALATLLADPSRLARMAAAARAIARPTPRSVWRTWWSGWGGSAAWGRR
jgi:hypothetical protein